MVMFPTPTKKIMSRGVKTLPREGNPLRRHLCWLLRHRYRAIWFKTPSYLKPGEGVGVADTEAGCVYCGHQEPNWFPMDTAKINWEKTEHRFTPPFYNTYKSPD